jgi:hypothetical protein
MRLIFIDTIHYHLSDSNAGRLAKPFGGLPAEGMEKYVKGPDGRVAILSRTGDCLHRFGKRDWCWCIRYVPDETAAMVRIQWRKT